MDIEKIRDLADFKIFVDIGDKIRRERLIEFYTDYKKYTLDEAEEIIKPREKDEVEIIKKTKEYADVMYVPEKTD